MFLAFVLDDGWNICEGSPKYLQMVVHYYFFVNCASYSSVSKRRYRKGLIHVVIQDDWFLWAELNSFS